MRRAIGIMGGGTRTSGRCFAGGREVAALTLERASNPRRVGLAAAVAAIEQVVAALEVETAASAETIALAIAGTGDPEWARRLKGAVEEQIVRQVFLTTDAAASLAAVAPEGVAAVLIAGTGSICLLRDEGGVVHRSGGHLAEGGDPGSAEAIGTAALRALAGGGFDAETAAALRIGGAAPAPLATIVSRCAEQGSEAARAILQSAAGELLRLTNEVLAALPTRPEVVPIGLMGGVLENSRIVRGAVQQGLARCFLAQRPRMSPEAAALHLAARDSGRR